MKKLLIVLSAVALIAASCEKKAKENESADAKDTFQADSVKVRTDSLGFVTVSDVRIFKNQAALIKILDKLSLAEVDQLLGKYRENTECEADENDADGIIQYSERRHRIRTEAEFNKMTGEYLTFHALPAPPTPHPFPYQDLRDFMDHPTDGIECYDGFLGFYFEGSSMKFKREDNWTVQSTCYPEALFAGIEKVHGVPEHITFYYGRRKIKIRRVPTFVDRFVFKVEFATGAPCYYNFSDLPF